MVSLVVADSFTHSEKGAVRRVDDHKNHHEASRIFSLCTPQIQADSGAGSARTAIGRSPSTGVLWLCMTRGTSGHRGLSQFLKKLNGQGQPRP